MRIKFIDKESEAPNKVFVAEVTAFYLNDENKIRICMDRFDDYLSTRTLFSTYDYNEWLDALLRNGYLDLSKSGYEFVQEDDEDDE